MYLLQVLIGFTGLAATVMIGKSNNTAIPRVMRTKQVLLERWNLLNWIFCGALRIRDKKKSHSGHSPKVKMV